MFLLQQLSRNLFLRSYIDGVELLVFTSKVLQKEYRSEFLISLLMSNITISNLLQHILLWLGRFPSFILL